MVAKWISREVPYGGAPAVPTSRMHGVFYFVLGECRQGVSNPGPQAQKAQPLFRSALFRSALFALLCGCACVSHTTLCGRRARRAAPSASPKKISPFWLARSDRFCIFSPTVPSTRFPPSLYFPSCPPAPLHSPGRTWRRHPCSVPFKRAAACSRTSKRTRRRS